METTWKKLKLFYYIGQCAIEMDKGGWIKSMPGWRYLLRWLAIFLVISSIGNSGYVYIWCTNNDTTPLEVFASQAQFYKTPTDSVVLFALMTLIISDCLLVFIENFLISRRLPGFWKEIVLNGGVDDSAYKRSSNIMLRWILG